MSLPKAVTGHSALALTLRSGQSTPKSLGQPATARFVNEVGLDTKGDLGIRLQGYSSG